MIMILDDVKDLYGVNERKYVIPENLIRVIEENFIVNGLPLTTNKAIDFIEKNPQLLNHTALSLEERFDLFEEFGWTNKRIITEAFLKNRNILTMDASDLSKKVYIFNSLGFSSDFIIKHPLLLSCPSKDIKLKFMLGSFEHYNVRNVSFFMQSLKKSYARICFLATINESVDQNLTLSEKQFFKKFGVQDEHLQNFYQLSAEAVNAIERNYNEILDSNGLLPEISLTRKEKQESIARISVKELKKYFKLKKEQEDLEKGE